MSRNPTTTLVSIASRMSLDDRMSLYSSLNATPTDTKNEFIQPLNAYASKPMSEGNSKLDASILIFDMLAVDTCLNCATCKDTCYAIKAQRQYINVLMKMSLNTYLARYYLPILHNSLRSQLHNTNKRIVRIHSSGDFINQSYVNMWTELAEEFTHIKFYSYTKVENLMDFTNFESLPNTNIVRSILPNGKPNYGTLQDMLIMAKELHCPICAYRKGMSQDAMPHCGKNCTACMDHKHVLFIQH